MRTLAILLIVALSAGVASAAQTQPRVYDQRLELTLFAEQPDIVTPIGLAIAPDDRVFVIESHTHLAPKDYPGPKGDRIRIFHDQNNDGQADQNVIFAEGLEAAMNLTITSEGRIFVVGAKTVWELIDQNGDNRCDEARVIVNVETSNTYPHSCLLGITHHPSGWLYIGRGNNGSAAYTISGSDGSSTSGYGDGGNVVRCRFDGSKLSEFATGFWNLFDLEFDQTGRLLGVDNDPDARGPNRLVHIVENGDYGYQSIYGGGGNHPYQSWNGELPGTLPFISGTGEAPSGLLDARRANLPPEYDDSILVTVWNENTIERHQTRPADSSLQATSSVLVSGSQDFRPVAIDADRHGNIFISDWVKVDYPNHGMGKIWRLASRKGVRASRPARYDDLKQATISPRLEELRAGSPTISDRLLTEALQSKDPFKRHSAIQGLSKGTRTRLRDRLTRNSDAAVRLGALLAQRKNNPKTPGPSLKDALGDSSIQVRQAALEWIGEEQLVQYRPEIKGVLKTKPTSPALFDTYLATIEVLNEDYLTSLHNRVHRKANQIQRQIPDEEIRAAILDQNLTDEVRAMAVTRYRHRHHDGALDFLSSLIGNESQEVQQQAIRSLSDLSGEGLQAMLLGIAKDSNQAIPLRREALVALEKFPIEDLQPFIELTRASELPIVIAAVRFLALHANDPKVKSAFNRCYVIHRNRPSSEILVEQLEDLLYSEPGCCQPRVTYRPQILEEWQHALARGGDAEAGETVFYSLRAGCAQCHTIDNRGGKLGPDLSNAGQSVSREQLVHSILRPSDQFPPQYQAWVVETSDGEEHRGLQLDHKAKGAIELFTLLGQTEHFEANEIERYYAAPNSLMPDGLEAGLSTSEMRDLVAFLESRN